MKEREIVRELLFLECLSLLTIVKPRGSRKLTRAKRNWFDPVIWGDESQKVNKPKQRKEDVTFILYKFVSCLTLHCRCILNSCVQKSAP